MFFGLNVQSKAQCVFPFFSSGTYNCITGQAVGDYTINGSTPPHTVTIVNVITTATLYTTVLATNIGTLPPIPVGNYSVYGITSAPGCTFVVSSFNVISPISPSNLSFTSSISCPAAPSATVSAFIVGNGLQPPFTYTWSNGSNLSSIANVGAGIYTLTVGGNGGCTITKTIEVMQPPPAAISFSITQPSCAYSTNGAVKANVTNAPLAYSYTWQPGLNNTSSLSAIPAGVYTLTVKDGSTCLTKSVVTVAALSSMTVSKLINPENCTAADGAFTININGGSAPYTFSTSTIGTHTNNILNGLSSGVYTTIVTDNGGCKDTLKTIVGNLSTVSLSIISSNTLKCFGQCTGSVQLNVQNGIPPFTFSATGTPTTSSSLITNLCAGTVQIKVLDAIGCPATTSINFVSPPVFSYSTTNPPAVCNGKNFTLTASAFGGSGSYTYVWNPGNLSGQTIVQSATASTVYSLNVYDSNNCTLAPYLVTVSVNAPLSININSSNSGICPGTTAQITPSVAGGDGNYTYNWQPGNLTGASVFIQNAAIPFYTLTVTDACGSAAAVKVITVNIFPVIVPTFTVSQSEGCEPFCTQFINTTFKSSNVIWNYGDRPFEQSGAITNYCYANDGLYPVRITVNDSNNCKTGFTYTNVIRVHPKPSVEFYTEPSVLTLNNCSDVEIKNATRGGKTFEWKVNGLDYGIKPEVKYTFSDTGCVPFTLISTSENGCMDTLVKNLCVIEGFNFWIPSSFTPNGDGLNDVFKPIGTGYIETDYLFEVYNRWGNRIYRTRDIAGAWDGKTKGGSDEIGQYMWYITVRDNQDNVHRLKGFVDVVK